MIDLREKMAYIASSYSYQHDGISVYLENILFELSKLDSISIDVYIKKSVKEKLITRIGKNNNLAGINFITLPDTFIFHITLINYYINIKKYALVFSPCLTPVLSIRNQSMKVIHDVTYKVFSKSLSSVQIAYKKLLFWLLNFDNYYGYISDATLNQIKQYTKLTKSNKPMMNLSNGIPFTTKEIFKNLSDEVEKKFHDSDITFLFVGSMNYHKGLDIAVEFVRLVSLRTDSKIIFNIAGKQTDEGKEIISNNKKNINFELNIHGYISDEDLYKLYSKSKYILCFSHSEGFGLPIVEALSFKVFPLLSDLPVFRELTDNSLFYYSHEQKNMSEFINNFFSIEGNFSENQYTKNQSDMIDRYNHMYSFSALKIYNIFAKRISENRL